jgi:[protein-PII] uridylyltransferase
MARIEAELPAAVDSLRPLRRPPGARVAPRAQLPGGAPRRPAPDEKAQHWLLSVSASDRTGLLYSIARVLAAHAISVELAKVTTLGERVEDVFLLRGEQLQQERTRVSIEQELLQALEPS